MMSNSAPLDTSQTRAVPSSLELQSHWLSGLIATAVRRSLAQYLRKAYGSVAEERLLERGDLRADLVVPRGRTEGGGRGSAWEFDPRPDDQPVFVIEGDRVDDAARDCGRVEGCIGQASRRCC